MKQIVYIFLLICIPGYLSAQQQHVFDLKSCLQIGLDNNFSIRISRNAEEISKNNVTLANAGFLPTLDLTGSYTGNLNTTETTLRETGAKTKTSNIYDQTLYAGISLNWTIFDGFNITTNYQKLKELEKIGETNTRITIEDFIANLTAEYYNFLQQKIRLNNLRYAVSLSKERLRIVEARYNIGSFSRLDLQQARVDFNADSSKYMKQQELVNSSRISLNELMARRDLDQELNIPDSVIDVNMYLNFDELWNGTLLTNANLLKAEQNRTLTQLDLKTVNSRNYPYVRLNSGYGYTLNKYEVAANSKRSNLGLNAGVTVGFNIFDGNRRRERKNALIAIENARLQRQQLEQALQADITNLWQAYLNNIEILMLERENLVAAKENHEIATERYMLGDLSGIEMREAQKSLLDAEERILSAEYETKLCEISLLQISGRISHYLE
ncbi:TolC family protein [Bacteroides sp. 519]|uniref:TolC family protein n=1 Tax=Bacteroides sp. 519 TaxID=2302937 RepID=UPI0013D55F9B|nr:TolC family protein [Bacteroides sp. 519]NDV60130.1 TolC family protein [Bacteroides sp. 519]